MPTHPTPKGISALLRDAGFASVQPRILPAVRSTKSIEGFRVHRHSATTVTVGFQLGPERSGSDVVSARFEEMLSAYARVIEAAGWRVRRDVPNYTTSLIVSAKAA